MSRRPYWLVTYRRRFDDFHMLATFWTLERARQHVDGLMRDSADLLTIRLVEFGAGHPERILVNWTPMTTNPKGRRTAPPMTAKKERT